MILYEFPILCYWYVYKRNVAVMLIGEQFCFATVARRNVGASMTKCVFRELREKNRYEK